MKKILYIVSTLGCSGPTSQIYNVISNLDRSCYLPILLTLSPESKESRWNDFEKLGVELHSLNMSRIKGLFLAKYCLKTLINKISPDFIHTQGIRADILLSRLNIKTPNLAVVHNYPQNDYVMTYGALKGFLMLRLHIRALKRIKRVVGCSDSVAKNLVDNFGLANVNSIQNGVDTSVFYPNAVAKDWLKEKLTISKDCFVWISSGHLSELKDPIFLISAWQSLIGNEKRHHLVFIGDGNLSSACRMETISNDNVHFLGRVSNVSECLQGADYFVSASKSEGLPMAAIEALACGLPVLLSDIDPHKEIIKLDDKIGSIYSLGSNSDFISSFKLLKDGNYPVASEAAIRLVKERLSAEVMSAQYQSIYKELIGA